MEIRNKAPCALGMEKEMATHFSVLVWRIPETGEPGRLPSLGSQRVEHNQSDLAAAAAAAAALGKTQKNQPSHSQMFSGKDFMSPNPCVFSYLEKH